MKQRLTYSVGGMYSKLLKWMEKVPLEEVDQKLTKRGIFPGKMLCINTENPLTMRLAGLCGFYSYLKE